MNEPAKKGFERKVHAIVTDTTTYLTELAKFGTEHPDHDVIKVIESCQVVQQPEAVWDMLQKKNVPTGKIITTVFISTVIVYDEPIKSKIIAKA